SVPSEEHRRWRSQPGLQRQTNNVPFLYTTTTPKHVNTHIHTHTHTRTRTRTHTHHAYTHTHTHTHQARTHTHTPGPYTQYWLMGQSTGLEIAGCWKAASSSP